MVKLISGGIYQFWRYWIRDRKFIESKLKAEDTTETEPLSLGSNVTFIFIVLIIGLVTASVEFVAEVLIHGFCKYNVLTRIKMF